MIQARHRSLGLTSFLRLRKYIGILGLTFPFQALLIAGYLQSISATYYNHTFQPYFIANLACIGLFLFADKGYDIKDIIANRIAGICALLVAFNPCYSSNWQVHDIGAIVLFITLGIISCFLFTQTNGNITAEKILRNDIYKTCGIIIFGCIPFIVIFSILGFDIFIPESICLVSFGISWLIKGNTFFCDK